MGFPTDWVIGSLNSSTIVDIDQITPIVLAGSLYIDITDEPERVTLYNNTYANGLTAGTIRSIFRITDLVTTGIERVGLVFMQNSPSISDLLDTGYGVFLNAGNGLSDPFVSISKFTTGLHTPPADNLLTTTTFTPPTLDDDFMLEVAWISDLGVLGGTQIYVRYALGTDFGDLTLIMEYLDTTTPIVATSFESLAVGFDGSGHLRVLIDETSIYEIV